MLLKTNRISFPIPWRGATYYSTEGWRQAVGPILVGMTGAFGTTGMAPREKDKDVISTCFTSRWRLGEKKMHGIVLWRLQSGKVAVFHTSGRPLKRKCTKGASPNLNSATTEAESKGERFPCGDKSYYKKTCINMLMTTMLKRGQVTETC